MLQKQFLLVNSIKPWENPKLSATGTIGGSTFAVTSTGDAGPSDNNSNPIWQAFDKNESTTFFDRCGSRTTEDSLTITMYNPNPVKLTSVTVTPGHWGFKTAILQYSDNGSSWTDLVTIGNNANTISHNGFHKYWRMRKVSYGNNSGGWRNCHVIEIVLKGWVTG